MFSAQLILVSFLKDFIYLFLERGREGEREGEKHHCVVASRAPPTGDLAYNPGMCPGNRTGKLLSAAWGSVHQATPARAKQACS